MVAVAVYTIGFLGSACIAWAVYKIIEEARSRFDQAADILGR